MQLKLLGKQDVYVEIAERYKEYIQLGVFKNGDKLPSIRELTETVGVNPNTIQKAYAVLDSEGLLVSAAGRGCFVSANATEIIKAKAEKQLPEFEDTVKKLLTSGISKEKLIEIINNIK